MSANEDLVLREARDTDIPRLSELFADSIRGLASEYYDADSVEAWAAFSRTDRFRDFILGNHTLVAEHHREIVGFGGIDDSGRIASLYVSPERSRVGIASRLLTELLEIGARHGVREFRTEASELSRPLFGKFGFAVVGRETVVRGGARIERHLMERRGGES